MIYHFRSSTIWELLSYNFNGKIIFRFFENIRKISTFITNAGEKERLIFFANMREKLKKM
ncbi:MAG TPA: hypothetical protein PKD51_02335 [Saprospiraceae bacterium]|nr:hypothetical protein [Saprospiraceae bacterium]HMU04445.1 hypothetical protein [Saprospiraceae bacterium]